MTASRPPVALVTGGSSGIGAAICQAFLDAGYDVVSLDLAPSEISSGRLHPVECNLLDAGATRAAAAFIAEKFAVSHLVHNAGAIRPALLENADPADLAALAQLHLAAPLLLLQAVLPNMRTEKFGRVLLVSSRAALGLATRTAYAATKAGMVGMARTWALELAPDGITVNVVAPGPIAGTRMFHDVVEVGSDRERALAASIPVKRLGRPDDISRAVMFFAARENGFVTGQTLFVCGGASVGTLAI